MNRYQRSGHHNTLQKGRWREGKVGCKVSQMDDYLYGSTNPRPHHTEHDSAPGDLAISHAHPQRTARTWEELTMYSRMRPWVWTGGAQWPMITPSTSLWSDSWRFWGASGTGKEATGLKSICILVNWRNFSELKTHTRKNPGPAGNLCTTKGCELGLPADGTSFLPAVHLSDQPRLRVWRRLGAPKGCRTESPE